jgi:hypothetical protein
MVGPEVEIFVAGVAEVVAEVEVEGAADGSSPLLNWNYQTIQRARTT